jgi:hypothetical protein
MSQRNISTSVIYKENHTNEEHDLLSLYSTIDLVLDLDLDHPKLEKESEIKM